MDNMQEEGRQGFETDFVGEDGAALDFEPVWQRSCLDTKKITCSERNDSSVRVKTMNWCIHPKVS